MPDPTNLLDPGWNDFVLHSRGGLVYAQQALPVDTIDLTQYVIRHTITESVREVARTLDFAIDIGHSLNYWRVHEGSQIVLYGHRIGADGNVQIGVPLFVGQIYTNTRTITPGVSEKTLKAYDFLTVLARTEGTLVFTNSTMTDIVKWICGFYEIPMGRIVDTEVPVGQIIQGAGTSAASIIEEAATRTLRRSGRKFFVRATDDNSALELLELGYTGVQWDLGDRESAIMTDYQEERSVENLRTVIYLVTEDTNDANRLVVVAERGDPTEPFFLTFGKLKGLIVPDNTTNAPDNSVQLNAEYDNRNRVQETATIHNLLLPGARQGDRVVMHLPSGEVLTSYIATVTSEHSGGDSTQTLEVVFDALGLSA
jgi:hypothetical protein